jgi:hypothetical protein
MCTLIVMKSGRTCSVSIIDFEHRRRLSQGRINNEIKFVIGSSKMKPTLYFDIHIK